MSTKQVKKLITFPVYVWKDVADYVMKKHHMVIPTHNFSIAKFIYSNNFDYKKFITRISDRQAMYLFTLICKKLGVAFIPDSSGWKIACLEETADELLEFAKHITLDAEETTIEK